LFPSPAARLPRAILAIGLTTLALAGACFVRNNPAPAVPTPPGVARVGTTSPGVTPAPAGTAAPTALPDPDKLLIRVNKQDAVGPDYVPPDLVSIKAAKIPAANGDPQVRKVVLPALERLFNDAQAAGVNFVVLSAYRSYDQQKAVLEAEIRAYGPEQAPRQVAEPGHSEHQLGTAIDFTSFGVKYQTDQKFGLLPEGRWLADNAHKYGFVMSFPDGKETITGYIYEPWHFRFVGPDVARMVRERGITLNEFLAR
jgi:D-alanyl-D-alanine carboxypeptidase